MTIIYKSLYGILLNALILFFLVIFVDGIFYSGGFKFFLIGGVILGLVNSIFKPIIKALSLPLIFLTGGLFLIVINMFVLWLLSFSFDFFEFQGITLDFQNFATYVIGAVVLGVINWLFNFLFK